MVIDQHQKQHRPTLVSHYDEWTIPKPNIPESLVDELSVEFEQRRKWLGLEQSIGVEHDDGQSKWRYKSTSLGFYAAR